MDTTQTEVIKNSVLQALDEYFEAARSGDPQRFLSVFIDNDELTVIENEDIRTPQEFRIWIKEFYTAVENLDAYKEVARAIPLCDDVAVVTGSFRFSAKMVPGDTFEGRNAFTFVFTRKGDRWLIHNVHESSLPVE